jgi:lipase maturation factor 1
MPQEPQASQPNQPDPEAQARPTPGPKPVTPPHGSSLTEPSRPLFVYDGECGFCRMWVTRWQQSLADQVDFAPFQEVADRFTAIPRDRFQQAVQWIDPDGTNHEAAAAIFRALASGRRSRWLWWTYRKVPLVAPICEAIYRLVAGHRPLMTRLTHLFWGDVSQKPTYTLSRSIFLRLLGAVYLIAFLSLAVQILGLVGERGINPIGPYMQRVEDVLADEPVWSRLVRVPTLCWFDASDWSLLWQCYGGAGLSLLLMLGIAPLPVLLVLWALYLSLSTASGVFLSFQWDTLLLEAGFLALFLAPLKWLDRPSKAVPPSWIALWLIRLLLFKLMFLSGVVKLTSGDDCWKDLTTLTYHYITQPLPAWTSWYAYHLPLWFQKVSLVVAMAIELVIPFFFFAPRNFRYLAAFSTAFLMLMIGLTGNYNFFNLLTIVLCVPLFDDRFWRGLMPGQWTAPLERWEPPSRPRRVRGLIHAAFAVVFLYISTLRGVNGSWPRHREKPAFATSEFANDVQQWTSPFRTINAYGLFRVMTRERPEIVIEGSNDGLNWTPYEFRWKPGDPNRRPRFVQPHQPRVDWQMWFAALGHHSRNPWLINMMRRMLQGSPEVLAFFEVNPFPDEPPKYLRAVRYQYRFSDRDAPREPGAWWSREYVGLYAPPMAR